MFPRLIRPQNAFFALFLSAEEAPYVGQLLKFSFESGAHALIYAVETEKLHNHAEQGNKVQYAGYYIIYEKTQTLFGMECGILIIVFEDHRDKEKDTQI